MVNDKRRELKEILANRQHIQDLQFRLDMVVNNAKSKGLRQAIGSTMTYAVVAKREARRQAKLKDRQFGSFRSSVTGKSLTYLKDGEYLPR